MSGKYNNNLNVVNDVKLYEETLLSNHSFMSWDLN